MMSLDRKKLLWTLLFVAAATVCSVQALTPQQAMDEDCCLRPMPWSMFCLRCWGACPLRVNGIERLEDVLRTRVFGQDESIERIVHALQNAPDDKSLVIHIAGDNGVGKTLTATTIAEALFSVRDTYTGMYKGLLYLRGNNYVVSVGVGADAEALEDVRERLRADIARQLIACPTAVVVFDEAELPHPETMQVFEEMLDSTVGSVRVGGVDVAVNRATFILISDFGTGGFTRNMSLDEIEQLVQEDANRVWASGKQGNRIQHIVPFMPIDTESEIVPQGVVDQVAHLLATINDHLPALLKERNVRFSLDYKEFSSADRASVSMLGRDSEQVRKLAQCIFNRIKAPGSIYVDRNYRGIEQMFQRTVMAPATQFVRKLNIRQALIADVEIISHQKQRLYTIPHTWAYHGDAVPVDLVETEGRVAQFLVLSQYVLDERKGVNNRLVRTTEYAYDLKCAL